MAFDEFLAQRIRTALAPISDAFTEKKMFGGITFLFHGKMTVGVMGDDLYVRVVSDRYAETLALDCASEMKFTGKAMKDFVIISPDGCKSEEALMGWINMGIEHAKNKLA